MKHIAPMDIERQSMATIELELGDKVSRWDAAHLAVVKRVIHASADFDYADNLIFSPDAVHSALEALRSGESIVTDTNMIKSGISKPVTAHLGVTVHCFMADPAVATRAKELGQTRATVSMEHAATTAPKGLYVVGNAPTALFKIIELFNAGVINPSLVVGLPVGFVNVVESKELLRKTNCPWIIGLGRKGGSSVAAACMNALLYQLWRP